MARSCEGKVARVTGASRGIGAAIARRLGCEVQQAELLERDPGEHVDDEAHTAAPTRLAEKVTALPWTTLDGSPADLRARYLDKPFDLGNLRLAFSEETLLRAAAKYGRAVAHATRMYRHLESILRHRPWELEVSVDETATPTSPVSGSIAAIDHVVISSSVSGSGTSAVHAGRITLDGGIVSVQMDEGMPKLVGSIRNDGSVLEQLVDGLRLLEYRGYDSSGVAVVRDGRVLIRKKAGRLDRLREALSDTGLDGCAAGIGHTRWATHGPPTDENAHPHAGAAEGLALVHNGIFENYLELKAELLAEGVIFRSETDTEVLAHLIERERTARVEYAVVEE